jgi:hypothetical protein
MRGASMRANEEGSAKAGGKPRGRRMKVGIIGPVEFASFTCFFHTDSAEKPLRLPAVLFFKIRFEKCA